MRSATVATRWLQQRKAAWPPEEAKFYKDLLKFVEVEPLPHYNVVLQRSGNTYQVGVFSDKAEPMMGQSQFQSFRAPIGEALELRQLGPILERWTNKYGTVEISSYDASKLEHWKSIIPRLLKDKVAVVNHPDGSFALTKKR